MEKTLDEGWRQLEGGEIVAARQLGEQVLLDNPNEGDAFLLLAACAREEGDDAQALTHLAHAVEADPAWSTPESWMAEVLANDPDRLDDALSHATLALDKADEEDEFLEALALKAAIELELNDPDAARETLEDVPAPETVPLDAHIGLEIANLCLAAGATEAARLRFADLTARFDDLPDAWYGLGQAAAELDDPKTQNTAWLRTWELDTAAPRDGELDLTEDEMVAEAEKALGEIPTDVRQRLAAVPILVVDLPARADVAEGLDPRALGLFVGTPLSDSASVGGVPALTQILLFRKNLERVAADEEELRDEIRTTLLHETGHFFGMSEPDLERVGLR